MVHREVIDETRNGTRYKFEVHMIKRPPDAQHSLVRKYLLGQPIRDRAKIVSRIMRMAELGPHSNTERYNDLGDGIFELKVGQHRIPFFYGSRGVIVLTHGFFKRQQQAPPREVARARELRSLYNRKFGSE